ncbi:MAG: hypothetical protein KF901_19505 [Myxococcales bacterium]|nr:hypothetical protein [Myxococcales bacterium]
MMQPVRMAGLALALTIAMGQTTTAQLPEDLRYDHAATLFNANSFAEARDGRRVDMGWALRIHSARIDRLSDREIARDSVMKFVIKKGAQTLGQTICRVGFPPGHIQTLGSNCEQRDQRIREHGELTVEVYFVDGANDREYLAATHTIHVVQYGTARGNGEPGENQYYVSASANLPVGVIVQNRAGATYIVSSNYNEVVLVLWSAHPSQNLDGSGPRERPFGSSTARLVCSVNGERVAIEDSQIRQNADGFVAATRSWGQARRDEQEAYDVRRFALRLPLTWGDRPLPNRLNLDAHPGRYECEIQNSSREVLRTISFTVADGQIQPHPEQATGLTLAQGAHLVEMRFPGSVTYETRLSRATAARGAFYGRPWQSPEARAMFDAVPNVGQPDMGAPARGGAGASSMRSSSSMRRR